MEKGNPEIDKILEGDDKGDHQEEWRKFIINPPEKAKVDFDEDAKHWFQKLPKTYEGRSFFDVKDDDNGYGKQEWAAIWSPYEMRSENGQEYLAMYQYEHIVDVPDNAASVLIEATGPTMYCTSTQYYKVDRKTNTMRSVGVALGKVTQPKGTYQSKFGREVTIAGWKMQGAEKEQLKFTDNHKVMLSSSYWHDGDIRHSIRVLFAQPTLEVEPLCPLWVNISNRSAAPSEDALAKKVEKLSEFMKCKFWENGDGNENKVPEVTVQYHFKNLDRLDTIMGKFEAGLTISLEWPVAYLDVVDYLGLSKEEKIKWSPGWEPPVLKVINAANNNSSKSTDYIIDLGKTTIQQDSKGYAVAVKSAHIKGEFFESLELENYPFDIQPLTVTLQTETLDIDKLPSFIIENEHLQTNNDLRIHSSEWQFYKYISSVDQGIENEHHQEYHRNSDWGQRTLQLAIVVKRKSFANVIRVIMMNGLFALLCLVGFLFPLSNANNRVSLGVTLLLTATAYSLVIAQDIPKLGYLTFSDKYIYVTFGYIFSITIQFAFLQFASELFDRIALFANLGIWFAYNVGALVVAYRMQLAGAYHFDTFQQTYKGENWENCP
jgi:hypothetical protein